jgi:hypothetical protein
VISTAQGALEKQFQRVWTGLHLRTPLDNDLTGTTLHLSLIALAVGGLSESPRLIRLDASQLHQLFLNLIGSTIKDTEKGIKAELRAKPTDHPRQLLMTMDMVDTGVGLASEDQFRILDLLFQAGWATAQSGTGLGLSICGQYAKLTGRILLEGTLGKGSGFHLELPVRRAGTGEVLARNEGKRITGLEPGPTGASHLNRRNPMEEFAGARTCMTTGRVRRASRKGQRAGCRDVSNLVAATYLDELASASYGRAGSCAPHPATRRRKGWQNSERLSVWLSACRGVGARFRSARTHIVPARSLGKPGPAARCGVTIRRSPASVDRGTLSAEAMDTLAEELRNQPIDALILLATEQIMATEGSNHERGPAFDAVLVDRAARFACTPILHPVQTCITNDAGG